MPPASPTARRGPESTAKTIVASEPPRAEMARLNASLMPRCRRWTTRVTAKPSTWAITSSCGVARSRPAPRTRSPMENVCASRCHWTWTTSASLIVKAAAQSTHGRVRAVGAPGSVRTTMTNSATAIAATEAVSSMIRWGTPRRDTRVSFTSTPFVIVVTSLRPAHAGPGHPGPAHAGPRHPGPAHAGPATCRTTTSRTSSCRTTTSRTSSCRTTTSRTSSCRTTTSRTSSCRSSWRRS